MNLLTKHKATESFYIHLHFLLFRTKPPPTISTFLQLHTIARPLNMSVNANSERTFELLHDQMYTLAAECTDESVAESQKIARGLLNHAELPMLYRVRAHINLAGGEHKYVWHAQEAVRWVEKGIEWLGGGPGIDGLMEEAQGTLRRATRTRRNQEAAYARWVAKGRPGGGYRYGEKDEDNKDEEDEEEEEEEKKKKEDEEDEKDEDEDEEDDKEDEKNEEGDGKFGLVVSELTLLTRPSRHQEHYRQQRGFHRRNQQRRCPRFRQGGPGRGRGSSRARHLRRKREWPLRLTGCV